MSDAKKCPAEFAGYDGWFGVYCELLSGHNGPHRDDPIIWWDLRDGPLPALPEESPA